MSPDTWDDKNDTHFLKQYANRTGCASVYALCLTAAAETYHHWKVFTHGPAGVCIEFNKDALQQSVGEFRGLKANSVIYKKIGELKVDRPDVEQLPFLKRVAFKDENEFRLIYAPTGDKATPCRVSVPLAAVTRVVLSPWLPSSTANAVRAAMRSISGKQSLKVTRSTLVDNPQWKQLA